jgi:hypothetical protein
VVQRKWHRSKRHAGPRSSSLQLLQGPECSFTWRVHCRPREGLRNKIVAGDPSPGSWSRHYTRGKPVTKQLDDFLMVARQVSMARRRKTPAWPGRFEAATIICGGCGVVPAVLIAMYLRHLGAVFGALTGRCPCPRGLGPAPGNSGGLMGNLRGCPRGPGYRGGPPATEVGGCEPAGNVDRGKRRR